MPDDVMKKQMKAYLSQVPNEERGKQFEAANQLMAACGNNATKARIALELFIEYKDEVFTKMNEIAKDW